ncbi:hypothetical protein SLG_03680 [Sphingobium sp. SYK-6]|uniref:CHAD domain-containing protein n=1 Tax=Sphingobium sp. (strain NBRC 103272 / SYK-6) TaxID=627192 RepID=UPI0002276E7C|nr:CHAD domain-containing protein [Sphingobium sp. SYK-6]BAK65043.1 hypothetical protein SLG_03680 [Sphingobium sp. SYK-6]
MPFRFRPSDDTVEAGFRRIACETLDGALALVRERAAPDEDLIHQVRRACKAMRGLLRLVRPAFPAWRTENAAFRDIGAALSGTRDRRVLGETIDLLARDAGDDISPAALAALRTALTGEAEGTTGRTAALLDGCAAPLLAARVRAESWSLTDHGKAALLPGLRQTYRKARRAMATLATLEGSPAESAASHEWRKQAKYHWQHMRLLRSLAPDHAGDRIAPPDRLGDLLGERHDLDMLLDWIGAQAHALPDPAAAALLSALARKRIARLMRKARRVGEDLFEDKPSAFIRHWHFEDSPG